MAAGRHLAVEQGQKPKSIVATIPEKADQARNRRKRGSSGGPIPTAWRWGSAASRDTAPSPLDMTSSPSATRRLSSSRPSMSGCDRNSSLELVVLGQFLPENAAKGEVGVLTRGNIQNGLEPDHDEGGTV